MMRYDNIDPTNYVVWDFSEVKKVVEKLVKARAKLFNNMHKSGTHTSQPEGFLDVALKSCDCFKSIGPCGLYYFYWKSKACTDYDSNFSPFLIQNLKGGSSDIVSLLETDESEEDSKNSSKNEDFHLERLSTSIETFTESAKKAHQSQQWTNKLTQLEILRKLLKDTDEADEKQNFKGLIERLQNELFAQQTNN